MLLGTWEDKMAERLRSSGQPLGLISPCYCLCFYIETPAEVLLL